jgi:tetratricopeptide (TPR) repeat protein
MLAVTLVRASGVAVYVAVIALLAVACRAVWLWQGIDASSSTGLAVVLWVALLLSGSAYLWSRWSGYHPPPSTITGLALARAVPGALVAVTFLAGPLLELPLVVALPLGALAGALTVPRHRRSLQVDVRQDLRRQAVTIRDADEAARVIEEARQALQERDLDDDQRAFAKLNLTEALTTRATRTRGEGELLEALELMDDLVERPPPNPALLFAAAQNLVESTSAAAEVQGGGDHYERAVVRLRSVLEGMPPSASLLANTLDAEADLSVFKASRNPAGSEEMVQHYDEAVEQLREAVAAAPRGRLRSRLETKLAWVSSYFASDEDLDRNVERLRAARGGLRRASAAERQFTTLFLADVLHLRATAGAPSAERDLEEAEALCRKVIKSRSPELRARAMALLAQVLDERTRL